MSDLDKKWNQFKQSYNMDHLVDPIEEEVNARVFPEDSLVLVDNFDQACEEMMTIALKEYAQVLELATKVFALMDNLSDKLVKTRDHSINVKYKYYNKDSWMDRQNKIAELDPNDVSRRTIMEIEESTERYYPEIWNEKFSHLYDIKKSFDDLSMDVAHLMAHLTQILDQPDQYITITEDQNKGEAPF